MQTLLHRLRIAVDAFWFLPAVLMLVALGLSEAVVALDRAAGDLTAGLPFVSTVGASGSRGLLTAIGGSMLGVAATAFSITVSVIATASSTYGPRLVRNFMADRGNQLVLGVFGATFLYALLVLRTVREETDTTTAFVPHLAVTAAIVLAVLDVAVLIYFVHHIADSIQVSTLAAGVLGELRRTVEPQDPRPTTTVPSRALDPATARLVVRAEGHGFLQHVDRESLIGLAARADVVVRLEARPGDHVVDGDVLARGWTSSGEAPADAEELERRVRRHLSLGTSRTPEQDVRHAVQQLAEMAVRAMSPGTNDPYTAINAVIELGTGLVPLVAREDDGNGYERDGRLRLVDRPVPATEVVDLVFDQVRPHAVASPEVVLALLDLREVLLAHTDRADVVARLEVQRAALLRQFAASGPDEHDLDRVRRHARV